MALNQQPTPPAGVAAAEPNLTSTLPDERIFLTVDKVKFNLNCGSGYPGAADSLILNCLDGRLFLTNFRVGYMVRNPTPDFRDFEVPIRYLQNLKVHQPFFGANEVHALAHPVPGRGIPAVSQVKWTFTNGGAVDFYNMYSHILTILPPPPQQVASGIHPMPSIEPLPRYETVSENVLVLQSPPAELPLQPTVSGTSTSAEEPEQDSGTSAPPAYAP